MSLVAVFAALRNHPTAPVQARDLVAEVRQQTRFHLFVASVTSTLYGSGICTRQDCPLQNRAALDVP